MPFLDAARGAEMRLRLGAASDVSGLTRDRLADFLSTGVVLPLQDGLAPLFRQIDIARLRLLCELSDDLDETALGIVISLIINCKAHAPVLGAGFGR